MNGDWPEELNRQLKTAAFYGLQSADSPLFEQTPIQFFSIFRSTNYGAKHDISSSAAHGSGPDDRVEAAMLVKVRHLFGLAIFLLVSAKETTAKSI